MELQQQWRGISITDLFQASSVPQQQRQQSNSSSSSSFSSHHALIWGPPRCGKTSLLLQFAYNCALKNRANVTFLCKPLAFESNPPSLSEGVDPESDAFGRVTIKYVHDDDDLRKYFAAFHVQERLPRAVIVDDFHDLFNERLCAERFGHTRARETAMVKTLALCHDAINYANERGGSEQECQLLVSDSHGGDTPRLRFIYQRWLPQIFTIKALDFSTFSVSAGREGESHTHKPVHAVYTLLHNRLQLERIESICDIPKT